MSVKQHLNEKKNQNKKNFMHLSVELFQLARTPSIHDDHLGCVSFGPPTLVTFN